MGPANYDTPPYKPGYECEYLEWGASRPLHIIEEDNSNYR